MPRDATLTRARLLRAAERRLARDGVAGARTRDIVRDAGQANDSAVGYHFGSRQGLLEEIVARHMAIMEAARIPPGPTAGLREVVSAIVTPTAALLRDESGRDFLRITEQLAGWSGLGTGRPTPVLGGTVLSAQLARLQALVRADLGPSCARGRVAAMVTFLTASLAERARALEEGRRQPMSHERYVQDLVAMLAGALSAPQ